MKLSFGTDEGFGKKAKFGLIVLEADETLEPEFARVLNLSNTAVYHSRIKMAPEVNEKTLAQMEQDLPKAVGKLPITDFDVIGYGCTSASSVIGSSRVAEIIQKIYPNAMVTDPLESIIAAIKQLDVKNIGFITPYVEDVSNTMRGCLEDAGASISAFGSFEEGDDRVVARITETSIEQAARKVADQTSCDAIVISCTNLRCLAIIPILERELGIPVISSNQALAWRMMRMAGLTDSLPDFGRLFSSPS